MGQPRVWVLAARCSLFSIQELVSPAEPAAKRVLHSNALLAPSVWSCRFCCPSFRRLAFHFAVYLSAILVSQISHNIQLLVKEIPGAACPDKITSHTCECPRKKATLFVWKNYFSSAAHVKFIIIMQNCQFLYTVSCPVHCILYCVGVSWSVYLSQ